MFMHHHDQSWIRCLDEFCSNSGCTILSLYLFAAVIDLVDDLALMNDSMKGTRKIFANWKDSLERKALKINNRKT